MEILKRFPRIEKRNPVDAAKRTLYTVEIFGLMKLLDKGCGTTFRWYHSQF
jgi:hypothetical protein